MDKMNQDFKISRFQDFKISIFYFCKNRNTEKQKYRKTKI